MSQKFTKIVAELRGDLDHLSDYVHANPEMGNEEFLSAKAHMDMLEKHGFALEKNVADVETAFIARFDSGAPGPKVAYLAEYDALPDIGHACGHNLIGAVSTIAAAALSKVVGETGGAVYLYGTPAEETDGFKVTLCEKGLLRGIDAAMIAHPAPFDQGSGTSVALVPYRVTYRGAPAHAATAPEKGINALDAVIFLFNGVNALREHVPESVRMHGVIREGGAAPNIVPEKAVAEFNLRAKDRETMAAIERKFKTIAEGAALMAGATLELERGNDAYDAMRTNEALAAVYNEAFEAIAGSEIEPGAYLAGSIDMGNVSSVVPSIHPWFDITSDRSVGLHTREFAEAAGKPYAKDRAAIVTAALAETGYRVLTDKALLSRIQKEFAD